MFLGYAWRYDNSYEGADRSVPRAIREWARFAATQGCPKGKLAGLMAYHRTLEQLARHKAEHDAWRAWESAAPRHRDCGQPVLPAGPGRLRYLKSGEHVPARNHLWCHGGHDWLEPSRALVRQARTAWQACAAVVFADWKAS